MCINLLLAAFSVIVTAEKSVTVDFGPDGEGGYPAFEVKALDGDVVVAFVNNEFTIKYLDLSHKEEGYIELRPANRDFQPIRIDDGDRFEVWGVVVWTIKNWRHKRPN